MAYICYATYMLQRNHNMKKTMIYLHEATHEGLRKLAFDRRVSIAELVRQAIDTVYGEDMEDIRDMEEEIRAYEADPSSAVDLDTFLKQREARMKQPKARVHR